MFFRGKMFKRTASYFDRVSHRRGKYVYRFGTCDIELMVISMRTYVHSHVISGEKRTGREQTDLVFRENSTRYDRRAIFRARRRYRQALSLILTRVSDLNRDSRFDLGVCFTTSNRIYFRAVRNTEPCA